MAWYSYGKLFITFMYVYTAECVSVILGLTLRVPSDRNHFAWWQYRSFRAGGGLQSNQPDFCFSQPGDQCNFADFVAIHFHLTSSESPQCGFGMSVDFLGFVSDAADIPHTGTVFIHFNFCHLMSAWQWMVLKKTFFHMILPWVQDEQKFWFYF